MLHQSDQMLNSLRWRHRQVFILLAAMADLFVGEIAVLETSPATVSLRGSSKETGANHGTCSYLIVFSIMFSLSSLSLSLSSPLVLCFLFPCVLKQQTEWPLHANQKKLKKFWTDAHFPSFFVLGLSSTLMPQKAPILPSFLTLNWLKSSFQTAAHKIRQNWG